MSTEDNHGWETVTKPQKKLKDKHKKAFLQDSDSEADEPKLKKINLPNLARDRKFYVTLFDISVDMLGMPDMSTDTADA